MCPRTGRPPKKNPRNVSLNIRITRYESELIRECAEKLGISRTDTIIKGIGLVKKEINSGN